MRKLTVLAIIIAVLTVIAAVVPVLTSYSAPVTGKTTLSSGQSTFLFIILGTGHTVTGSFNFTGGNGTTGFQVYSPNGTIVVDSETHAHEGNFTFTAGLDGAYTFDVLFSEIINTYFIYYQYSVVKSIFGLNPTIFVGLAITVGVVLILIIAILNYVLRSKKKCT
jgi:hypothetical protein